MAETRASSASPERFEQHLVAAGELLRRNDVAGARTELAAALVLRPDDVRALGLFGLACFRQSAFDDALPVYQKLVALRPDDASHRLNLGLVYLKVGQPDLSLHELGRSRELDPGQQRTVSYLGLAHARRGDYAEAFEAFLRAGEEQLAAEMEQYLSTDQRAAIRERAREARTRSAELGIDSDVYETVERRPALIVDDLDPPDGDEGDDSAAVAEWDDGGVEEFDEVGVITKAVALAVPAAPAAATGTRVGWGQEPPRPLTELATRQLIRPDDGDHPFEVGPGGALIVRVSGRILSRTGDVIVSCGNLRFEPATRRVRGAASGERFGDTSGGMSVVTGQGYLIAAAGGQVFAAVALNDDIFYLRESMVYAFEDQLRWETGHVPGADEKLRPLLRVVQFRGRGCVALRTQRRLLSLNVATSRAVRVDARVLAGWIGRVVPRVVSAGAVRAASASEADFVECSGEGVVLLEDQGGA